MTILIAKFLAVYFLGIGLALLLNPNGYRERCQLIMKNEGFLCIAGVIALMLGAFIVSVHNIWVMEWPVIITIIGWISVMKGFALLAYADFANLFSFMLKQSANFYRAMGAIVSLLGLFFAYEGWWL
jgi:hypothetical protein